MSLYSGLFLNLRATEQHFHISRGFKISQYLVGADWMGAIDNMSLALLYPTGITFQPCNDFPVLNITVITFPCPISNAVVAYLC